MRRAWVGLGSNLGSPVRNIRRALSWLDRLPGVRVDAVSTLRWTQPMGPPQPPFLNGAARLWTSLPPRPLLRALQGLERAAGRRRGERWGPRSLDLDLLLYEDRTLDDQVLTLPHPGLQSRPFVLEPLCDLDPEIIHPALGRSLADLFASVSA